MGGNVSKDFVKEVGVWLNLDYLNIVKLLDYDVKPRPYVMMKSMDGSLEVKLPPLSEAVPTLLSLIDALEYAHSKGVVYGYIKPDNVLVSREWWGGD